MQGDNAVIYEELKIEEPEEVKRVPTQDVSPLTWKNMGTSVPTRAVMMEGGKDPEGNPTGKNPTKLIALLEVAARLELTPPRALHVPADLTRVSSTLTAPAARW